MNILDTEKIKKDFPIFKHNKDLVYLDSAASSQTPLQVLDALSEYYNEYRSNIHRSTYPLGERATQMYEDARGVVAKFIGADKNEIIFTGGSTMGMNMLMYSLESMLNLSEGDLPAQTGEIVTTVEEHHSSLIPLQQIAKRRGLVLKHINITADFNLDYEQAKKLITNKTKRSINIKIQINI